MHHGKIRLCERIHLCSPLAKARDEWLESVEGKQCLTGSPRGIYLENRLVLAFLAGARTQDIIDNGPRL